MLIAALPDLLGSATLRAVRVTMGFGGRICGAVYVPFASTVPQVEFEQPAPARLQVTERFGAPVPVTCAAKDCIAPSSTIVLVGATVTAMSLVIITIAVLLLTDESATLVATIDTVAG
jgi:hypothetical protein